MNIQSILANYGQFKEQELKDRFFKHSDITGLLRKLPAVFEVKEVGQSVRQKSIHVVKWGKGQTKIMLWSQMHGNEATGTMAIFDLFNFLQKDSTFFKDTGISIEKLYEQVQLFIIPMVNPDGAEVFTRRNAQLIDLNRDYLQEVAPESKLLKSLRNEIQPDFGFNLHDQVTLWSVTDSLKPATLSYLAPPTDPERSTGLVREKAMLVIADIFKAISPLIPGHIGLFDDEFEPRAFGDNFQKAGTSTILIEAGGFKNDYEKQEIRQYYFGSMLSGICSIAEKTYEKQKIENYLDIPENNKQIFHILIHNVTFNNTACSLGINYDEKVEHGGLNISKIYTIADIGDLSFCDAYEVYNAGSFTLSGEIEFEEKANFRLMDKNKCILSFENGKML